MARATETFSARWGSDLLLRLKRRSEEFGINKSRLAERYVEEGLRMDQFPGIVFVDGAAGRRAALATGPDVWQLAEVFKGCGKKGEEAVAFTADLLDLGERQVKLAVGYYAAFPGEIDEFIGRNRRAAEEAEAAWLREQDALA